MSKLTKQEVIEGLKKLEAIFSGVFWKGERNHPEKDGLLDTIRAAISYLEQSGGVMGEAELVKLIQDNTSYEVKGIGIPSLNVTKLARALMQGGYGEQEPKEFCGCFIPKPQYHPNVPNWCMGCGKSIKPAEKLPQEYCNCMGTRHYATGVCSKCGLPQTEEDKESTEKLPGKLPVLFPDERVSWGELAAASVLLRDTLNKIITWAHDIERRIGK